MYRADAAGEAQVQASAAVQSMVDHCQILEVGASLGQDPQNTGGLLVYMAVTAAGRLPLGVAYRVTAEAGIVVDQHLGLVTAHDIATDAHHRLLHEIPKLAAVTIHVSPQAAPGTDHHQILEHHQDVL